MERMDFGEQFAENHLRGRALQENRLLLPEERDSYDTAIKALQKH